MTTDQDSMSWAEIAELTHATQIERFNFCMCEDNEGNENPYNDCPKEAEQMTNSKVVVQVLGGVAYLVSAPAGIDVEIIDLDNAEGEDDERAE